MDREQRLVFGEDAELYDRARPSYPSDLIDDVIQLIGPAARVVDAGCGTGKASVMLASGGIHGVGLEPRPEMAAIARRHLEGHSGWRIDIAGFEDWTPAANDLPFDAVVSAQAWVLATATKYPAPRGPDSERPADLGTDVLHLLGPPN